MNLKLTKKITLSLVLSALIFAWLYYREVKRVLSFPANSWTEEVKADCAVVLTGGPGRVREGFDLLAQGRVKKLIISGVYPGAELIDIFPQKPFYGSLDESNIILERRSGTTYGNAQQTLPLVEALGCRDLALVTSALHMYRSRRIFKSVFPPAREIYPVGIVSGRIDASQIEILVEATKSIFYSIWAY